MRGVIEQGDFPFVTSYDIARGNRRQAI